LYGRETRDVWAYQGVFWDGRFNGTMHDVVGLTHKISARCGDPVAYRLVLISVSKQLYRFLQNKLVQNLLC